MYRSSDRTPGHGSISRFAQGPITPTLMYFALPLLATNLLHALAGTWAAAWAGHVLGPDALSAMATGAVLLFMLMGAAIGIGTAAGVTIGHALGAGRTDEVRRVVGCALALVVTFSLLVAAAVSFGAATIVDVLGTPALARPYAIQHLRFTGLSLPVIFMYLVVMMMLRSTGDAHTPFRFTLVWIALSLLLVPVLLTGLNGLVPDCGIAGVGLANLLAATCALALLARHAYRRHLPIALGKADLPYVLRPPLPMLRLIVRRSLPVALEALVTQGAYFVLLIQVNAYGLATATAYSGAAQLWAFVQMPSNALAASMTAIAALNIGAGQWQRVEQIARRGCLLSVAVSSAIAALIYVLGLVLDELPLRLFITDHGEALAQARQINHIVLWGWIALAVTLGLMAVVRANGAMLPPALIFIVTMWLCRVPFALGLKSRMGEAAIWWSFPFGTIASALLAWAYYRWGMWRRRVPVVLPANH